MSPVNALVTAARHDLYWAGWQQLGLQLADGQTSPLMSPSFAPESVQKALKNRATMLAAIVLPVPLTPENSHAMLCGNPDMVRDTQIVLEARGMRRHRRREPGHFTLETYW